MDFQVHKRDVGILFFVWGVVLSLFLAMLCFDFHMLLASGAYNSNIFLKCMCWYFTLSTFPFQGVFSTIKLLDYFQYKFLEPLPKQTKARNPAHHKNKALKREESNFIYDGYYFPHRSSTLRPWTFLKSSNRESTRTKISCICGSGQKAWNRNWDLYWQL